MSSVPPTDLPQPPAPAAPAASHPGPAAPPVAAHTRPSGTAGIGLANLLLGAVAAAALTSSVLLWQKLSSIQEQLARQSADSGTLAIEARTIARQAEDQVRETAARLSVAEARVSEVALQRSQLEELMQSLSRSRDENLVVDIESAASAVSSTAAVIIVTVCACASMAWRMRSACMGSPSVGEHIPPPTQRPAGGWRSIGQRNTSRKATYIHRSHSTMA